MITETIKDGWGKSMELPSLTSASLAQVMQRIDKLVLTRMRLINAGTPLSVDNHAPDAVAVDDKKFMPRKTKGRPGIRIAICPTCDRRYGVVVEAQLFRPLTEAENFISKICDKCE